MHESPMPDWYALSALYDEAQALDDAERRAWLLRLQTAGHPQWALLQRMLAEAEALLADDFLLAPPTLQGIDRINGMGARDGAGAALQAGDLVEAYRLIRPLGAGGMAEVWLAERADGAFVRQVALKLLQAPVGPVRQQAFRQRFEREHRILASLRHPHIAALHDAGVTQQGQHWLALEYVDGLALDAWCDARRQTLRQRVTLFGQVLQAVSHAHGRLVIHRDLKPSNVLVTTAGEVRLLDFGIAALIDSFDSAADASDLTRQGGRPLTPRYASPEQLQGLPLGTASDVYSLGVMLHELLSGTWPYPSPSASARAMERAVLETEPLAPSRAKPSPEVLAARASSARAWHRELAPDLDAIVLRAMARAGIERYGSVDALHSDLNRWLAGEPVHARQPGWAQRAWKFSQRHPWGTGLSSLAVAALMATTAWASWNAQAARVEAQRARSATDFVLRLFEDADPDNHGGRSLTPIELLERGRLQLARAQSPAQAGASASSAAAAKGVAAGGAESAAVGDRSVQVQLLNGIARTQYEMGEHDAAALSYAQSQALLMGAKDASALAWTQVWRAENDLRRGQMDAAKAGLAQSRQGLPDAQAGAALRVKRLEVQGWVAHWEGRLIDASHDFQAALAALPSPEGAVQRVLDITMAKAQNDAQRGDAPAALAALDRVQTLSQTERGLGPGKQHELALITAVVWDRLGAHVRLAQATPDALARCEQAYSPQSELCRKLHLLLLRALVRQGQMQLLWQRWPRIMGLIDGRNNAGARVAALLIANRVAWQAGDATAREQIKSRLQELLEGRPSAGVALRATLALAEAELYAGDARAALARLQTAREKAGAPGTLKDTALDAQLSLLEGQAWDAQGDRAHALQEMTRAQSGFAKALGENHPLTLLWSLNQLAPLAALGQAAAGLVLLDKAQPMVEQMLGPASPVVQRLAPLRRTLVQGVASAASGFADARPAPGKDQAVPYRPFD